MANDTGQKVIRLSRSESEREKRETERGRKREKTDGWMTINREGKMGLRRRNTQRDTRKNHEYNTTETKGSEFHKEGVQWHEAL